MLRATVLTALTRLGDGSARDPKAALAGTEPILRPFAQKKILRAQVDAQLATRLSDDAHVARLAARAWGRVAVLDADDVDAVRAELERLPKVTIALARRNASGRH